jgi:antitoxin YefM
MDAITYSHARENLAATMNRVCEDHEPVIITRQKAQAVVMMSLDDYNAIQETAYLLRSPANAARLRASLAEAAAGNVQAHPLMETDGEAAD